VQNIDQEYANYRAGQYDYTDVPGRDYSFARGQVDFHEIPTLTTRYFGLNFDLAPFDNVFIRRAFDLALNKQLMVDRVLNGGSIPTNHIVPFGIQGTTRLSKRHHLMKHSSLTGNQSAATGLIQQVVQSCQTQPADYCPFIVNGAHSQEIDVWYHGGSQTVADITQAAVNQWNLVLGLNIKAKVELDGSTFFGNVTPHGPYQAWNIGWVADYPDPQDWLTLQFHSGGFFNASDVNSSDLDQLMDKADVEQNAAVRMSEYNQAEQAVVDLGAWIPYAQDKVAWRLRPWVQGFR